MLIIWGTRQSRSRLGYAADFCPICRNVQQFQVSRHSIYNHFWYIPISRRQTISFPAKCRQCQVERPVDAVQYAGFSRSPFSDTEIAIAETNPDIHRRFASRIELEQRVRSNSINENERQSLIQEPFSDISKMIEKRYANETPFDRRTLYAGLLTIVVPHLLIIAGSLSGVSALFDVAFFTALIIGLVGMLVTVCSLVTVHSRFNNRVIYPALAGCLKTLRPTEDMLEQVLRRYKTARLKIGRKIKASRIMQAIESAHV